MTISLASIVEVYSSQHHDDSIVKIKHDRKTNALWVAPIIKNEIKMRIKRAKSKPSEYLEGIFPSINVKIEEKFQI